jgi:hypothetical protein
MPADIETNRILYHRNLRSLYPGPAFAKLFARAGDQKTAGDVGQTDTDCGKGAMA